jgi:biopolymer transport protein ExbD
MVVVDWVQQGRLIEEDQVRVSGTEKWIRVASTSALAAYLPKVEPYRVEDQAEVLEPVEVDFAWRHRPGEDESDVDMIPLIDISLVLLIFFIMTTTVAVATFNADLPAASFTGDLAASSVWVGLELKDGTPVYLVAVGDKPPSAEDRGLTEDQAVERVKALIGPGPAEVRIAADRGLKTSVVAQLTGRLQALKPAVSLVRAEVREKRP